MSFPAGNHVLTCCDQPIHCMIAGFPVESAVPPVPSVLSSPAPQPFASPAPAPAPSALLSPNPSSTLVEDTVLNITGCHDKSLCYIAGFSVESALPPVPSVLSTPAPQPSASQAPVPAPSQLFSTTPSFIPLEDSIMDIMGCDNKSLCVFAGIRVEFALPPVPSVLSPALQPAASPAPVPAPAPSALLSTKLSFILLEDTVLHISGRCDKSLCNIAGFPPEATLTPVPGIPAPQPAVAVPTLAPSPV